MSVASINLFIATRDRSALLQDTLADVARAIDRAGVPVRVYLADDADNRPLDAFGQVGLQASVRKVRLDSVHVLLGAIGLHYDDQFLLLLTPPPSLAL